MIYLDNASSTMMYDEVLNTMLPFLKQQYGNPSSLHKLGISSHNAIKKAKNMIASLINSRQDEIYITSGGTESNNTVIYGVASYNKNKNHIIVSSIEHDSILQPCCQLEKKGFEITYLKVDENGLINPKDVEKSINDRTCLVSIMFVNNEIGTIQPIHKISDICSKNNILFHSDCSQSAGKLCIDVKNSKLDMLTISSHKMNGPKGIGALYVRSGTKLSPLIVGGGQQNGFRSGTENVASIVGFGIACKLSKDRLLQNFIHFNKLQGYLHYEINKKITHVKLNGNATRRIPNNLNFSFFGINGEDLITKLDEHGIAVSTGSACKSNTKKASHVLKSMGLSYERINSSIRITIGVHNTMNEMKQTVLVLDKIIKELRSISPLKYKYNF
ncbi:MAG: cysteine desulfurase family protein [Thaumarchaeota archaeon]|nr:cysteine desulfurase family protein [Nitrososphaerota archaeon]